MTTDHAVPPEDGSFLLRLISKLAPTEDAVGEFVEKIRQENPTLNREDLAKYIGDRIVRTYTSQGAALALPGAIPGPGTLAQIGIEVTATSADLALLVRNQSYLVFALGHCFGWHGREVLIQDTLICMGLWANALSITKSGAIRLGTKVAEANFKKHFPAKILQAINRKVGTTILTKYGTKRGGLALGRLIPYGIGVGVAATFNYFVMKRFKSRTIKYFDLKAGEPDGAAQGG